MYLPRYRSVLVTACIIALALTLVACGSSSSGAPNNGMNPPGTPAPTPTPTPTPTPPPTAAGQFLFAPMGNNVSFGNDRRAAEYSIDPSSGRLTQINPGISAPNWTLFAFRDPGHNFIYFSGPAKNPPDFSIENISGYSVAPNNGALTLLPGSPYSFNNQQLAFTTIRPDRKFAYVADAISASTLHIVSMDPNTGAMLQEVGTITIDGSQNADTLPMSTFDSTGHYLYVINAENNTVAAYASDPASGGLAAVSGSPFSPRGSSFFSCSPKADFCGGSLAVSGNHLYYASELFAGGIAEFNIDPATGILTEAPGSPFATPQAPYQAKVTPDGRFLYVTSTTDFGPNNLVLGYSIDPVTGALTPVPGSPYSTTGRDLFTDIDESGQYFYTSAVSSIVGYHIDPATGALTLTPGSPYPINGITGLVIVH